MPRRARLLQDRIDQLERDDLGQLAEVTGGERPSATVTVRVTATTAALLASQTT